MEVGKTLTFDGDRSLDLTASVNVSDVLSGRARSLPVSLGGSLMQGFNATPSIGGFSITASSPAAVACTSGATFTCGVSSTQTGSTSTTATLLCTG